MWYLCFNILNEILIRYLIDLLYNVAFKNIRLLREHVNGDTNLYGDTYLY